MTGVDTDAAGGATALDGRLGRFGVCPPVGTTGSS
jgi:hypothetical protein